MTINRRVQHRVSSQLGTLLSTGLWYSAVRFDGEDATSWVANDSIERIEKPPSGAAAPEARQRKAGFLCQGTSYNPDGPRST
jgi:hypothetical protein